MVQKYKERFRLGSRSEKTKVIDEVVGEWRDQDPVGRFVAKKTTNMGEVVWYDVGNELAKKRAAKSLAEWAPQKSFGSHTTGKPSSTAVARKKRARDSSLIGNLPTSLLTEALCSQEQPCAKRQNKATESASPVTSFSVLSMSLTQLDEHQQFLVPVQQISQDHVEEKRVAPLAPLPLNQQLERQSEFLRNSVWAAPQVLPSSAGSNASPTQPCNINSSDVLPLERIRVALPTAAELTGIAFSDDEKSFNSNSSGSRGSHYSNGLLPNT